MIEVTFEGVKMAHLADRVGRPRRNWNMLVQRTPGGINLNLPEHRRQLILWLNRLNCHLPSGTPGDEGDASRSLHQWWETRAIDIGGIAKFSLHEMTDAAIDMATNIFADLQERPAGRHRKRRIGPTAASKVLMAVAPNTCPAWDKKIAITSYGGRSVDHFREHLITSRDFAEALRDKILAADLLEPDDRVGFGKLIDESFYWLVSVGIRGE